MASEERCRKEIDRDKERKRGWSWMRLEAREETMPGKPNAQG